VLTRSLIRSLSRTHAPPSISHTQSSLSHTTNHRGRLLVASALTQSREIPAPLVVRPICVNRFVTVIRVILDTGIDRATPVVRIVVGVIGHRSSAIKVIRNWITDL
jgi:hypothetical protein